MQDGQTATNPQTGERVVLRGGQWVPLGQSGTPSPPPVPAQPRAPAIIYGRPDPQADLDRQYRANQIALQQKQISEPSQQPPSGYRYKSDGALEPIPGGPADTNMRGGRGKPMRQGDANALDSQVQAYSYLKNAAKGFQDDYAGNLLGEAENWAQGVAGIGTPGQRDWWANFRTADNMIRHELYGAALTDNERKSYADTTITPTMSAAEVRKNLKRRVEIARDALARRVRRLKAAGFNADEIEQATGEFWPDFNGDPTQPPAAPSAPSEEPGGRPMEPFSFEGWIDRGTGMKPTGWSIADPESFTVKLTYSDGRTETVPAPASFINSDQFHEQYRRQFGEDPNIVVDLEGAPPSAPRPSGDPALEAQRRGAPADAAVRAIADTATFGFADELAAGLDTLAFGGTMRDNLARERATDRADAKVNPGLRFGGQVIGAVANPLGRGATSVGEVARAGGVGGALYGFGSGEDLGGRVKNALSGGVAGTLGGAAVAKGTQFAGQGMQATRNALLGDARAATQANRAETMAAAQRQGVDLMPADVGGPTTRRITGAAVQAPVSAGPVVAAGQRVIDQSRAARDKIAQKIGTPRNMEGAGDAVTRGGNAFNQLSRERVNVAYDRARQIAGDAAVSPKRALQVLYGHIRQLKEDPSSAGSAQLAALERLAENLAGRKVTIDGVRLMRTRLRQQYLDDGLRSSDFQRRIGEVVDAAAEDMSSGLAEQGLSAASQAFRRADQLYRGRVEVLDEVLEPIIGRGKSGEQIVQALETATKNNGRLVFNVLRALPAEERDAVRATFISRMGTKRADAEAEEFSLPVFLTQYRAMTPRAKAAMFAEARGELDDLAKVAAASKAATQYANHSNTAGGMLGNVGVYLGWGSLEPVSASLAAIGQYGAGKLMASPGFARWLARAPKGDNPAATRSWIGRLPAIATQTPAVRDQVEKLQARLIESLVSVQPRVAAEKPDEPR